MTVSTLALEHLMLHPRYPELVDALRRLAPTGARDQADAAAAEAHRLVDATRVALGGTHRQHASAGELPGWLRPGVLDAFTGWVDGRAETCRHGPDPMRPAPVLTAAWRPGVVACLACPHLVNLPDGTRLSLTCDCCGRVCTGPEHGDGIWPGVVQFGPLVFQYGTCGGCRPDLPTGGPLRATESAERDRPEGRTRVRPRGRRGTGRGRRGVR